MYDTLNLLQNMSVTGYIYLLILEMACDPTQHADLAAVIMQEGLANVCLITSNMTIVRAKIETNIPRKRKGSCTQHDKVSETESVISMNEIEYCGFTIVLHWFTCTCIYQESIYGKNHCRIDVLGGGAVFVDCKFFKTLWECKCNFLVSLYDKRIFNISIVVKEVHK